MIQILSTTEFLNALNVLFCKLNGYAYEKKRAKVITKVIIIKCYYKNGQSLSIDVHLYYFKNELCT